MIRYRERYVVEKYTTLYFTQKCTKTVLFTFILSHVYLPISQNLPYTHWLYEPMGEKLPSPSISTMIVNIKLAYWDLDMSITLVLCMTTL
jgi:hypothetical protein